MLDWNWQEQTCRAPFHRGPHRLSKLSEAASQHAQHLQNQNIQGTVLPQSRPPTTRASAKIIYDAKSFPSLPVRQEKNKPKTPSPDDQQTREKAPSGTPPSEFNEVFDRIQVLEQAMKVQQQEIQNINKTIKEQQQAIANLATLVTTQQQTIDQLKEAIIQLTTTVSNLEKITTHYFDKNNSAKPSPEYETPGKRPKIRTDENSPKHPSRTFADDPMEDTSTWETQTPNMTQNDSRSPSPSL